MSSRRIYVGNLHPDSRKKDIEELFDNYGRITNINLVNGSGRYERTPFAFVEFEDPRDARDAVDRRDGYGFMGRKLRVEFPKGDRDRGGDRSSRFGDRRGGGGGGGGFRGDRGGGGGGASSSIRRTKFRVMVAGLPASASWQDLKDHMRSAGEVAFTDVYKDGTGVVEFKRYEDMRYAVKKMENSKFRSHEKETSYISVKADNSDDEGGRSRSRSPRSRSKSRSPAARRSRSRSSHSKSKSPPARRPRSKKSHSKSKSPAPRSSRNRSRSPPLYQRHPDSKSPSPASARNPSPDRRRHGR